MPALPNVLRIEPIDAEDARSSSKVEVLAYGKMLQATVFLVLLPLLAAQRIPDKSTRLSVQLKTAIVFHERGDYAHSIPLLRQVVQASPRNDPANLLLGIDLVRSGRPREAIANLRIAVELRPTDPTPLDYIAAAAEMIGDFAMEADTLEIAVKRSGRGIRYLLAWGNFCLNRFHGLQTQALATRRGQGTEFRIEAWATPEGIASRESLLEQSVAADSDQRGIWGELGVAQLEAGKKTEAEASLIQAERREPDGIETLQLKALLAASDNKWQNAEEGLIAVGNRSPDEFNKVLAGWPAGLLPPPSIDGTLWKCLRKTIATCPVASSFPDSGAGMSLKHLYDEGRWERLLAVPNSESEQAFNWLWRGVASARLDDCEHAIPLLERGLQADEWQGRFYLQVCYADQESRVEDRLHDTDNRGALLELQGDRSLIVQNNPLNAQKEYLEALKAHPHDSRILAQLSEAFALLDDLEHARTSATSALASNPRQTVALKVLAQIAMNQRDYVGASVRLRQLAAVRPGDGWTQVELGIAYVQLGRSAEAVHYLAPQLAAGYPDPKGALHAQLASAFKKLGRVDEAQHAAVEASRLANASIEDDGRGQLDVH